MATLEIRRKTSKVWEHVSSDLGTYIVSKMYCKTNDDIFKIIESGGSKRGEYNYADITIYDDVTSGGAETFTSALALMQRLEALSYVGFYYDGDVIPADLISTDASNTLILGSDGKLYTAGGGAVAWGAITGTLSSQTDLQSALDAKQPTLVSGTNIKTINGTSILGSGNINTNLLVFSDTTFHAHTGSTVNTEVSSITIPANTISDGDVWEVDIVCSRNDTNFSGLAYVGCWLNSVETSVSATVSNVPIGTGSRSRARIKKSFFFKSGNVRRHKGSGAFYNDTQSIQSNTIDAFDLTIAQEIKCYLRLNTSTDVANLEYIIFRKIN